MDWSDVSLQATDLVLLRSQYAVKIAAGRRLASVREIYRVIQTHIISHTIAVSSHLAFPLSIKQQIRADNAWNTSTTLPCTINGILFVYDLLY